MTSAAVREPVNLVGAASGRHLTDTADLTRPALPGAASLAVREALDRPRFPARVIAVFPSAVYLELRPGSAGGRGSAPSCAGGPGAASTPYNAPGAGFGSMPGHGSSWPGLGAGPGAGTVPGGRPGLVTGSGPGSGFGFGFGFGSGLGPDFGFGSLRGADAGMTTGPEVLALVTSDAMRLPNSIIIPAGRDLAFESVREGDDAWVGDGHVDITAPAAGSPVSRRDQRPKLRLRVRVRRWWDPTPVLGQVSLDRLREAAAALEDTSREGLFGLEGHPGPVLLAERCAAGDLAHAVDAAERIVGLGPGLTPSGDDVLAGLLVSMRALGSVVPGGHPAIRLADWLGAAVTAHAGTRTTALAATLLGCAARGEAGAEVAAVLRGIAGLEPLRPAARRLLTAGHTSGTDLVWGLMAGCRATLALADSKAAV